MRVPSSALLVLAGTALLVAAVASESCTASTGPTFPVGAQVVPATYTPLEVNELPPACSGRNFFTASTSLCPTGLTYFLCDGNSYTEFDCSPPGGGWTEELLSEDPVGSGPGACEVSSGADAGSAQGTVYVEGNAATAAESAILVFRYCDDTLPPSLVARYPTGGTGAADLDDEGVLDADQQIAVNESQTLLFAVNQGSDSIAVFQIADDGLLTPVAGSPFPSGGVAPASVGVSGNILVVANKAFDGIRTLTSVAPNYATFSIQADGSLQPTGSVFTLPLLAYPTQVYVAPGGNLVFTTDESGVLRAFGLSPSGVLTQAPGSPVSLPSSLFPYGRPSPVWPAGLSAAASQPILYTGIPNYNSIAMLEFTDTGSAAYIGGTNDPRAVLPCWSVVSADGKRLYFANAGSDNITVWDIETDPKLPTVLQTFQMNGGGNPWGMHIDPTGQLLFAITPRQIHQVPLGQGQLLHALQIAADGTLSEIDGSPVPIPVAADTNPFGVAVVAAR